MLPPKRRVSSARSILWLGFPLVWTIYTRIRGAVSGRYPYRFLDPANGGYATIALYMIVILVFMLLLALGVSATSRIRSGQPIPSGGPTVAPSGPNRST